MTMAEQRWDFFVSYTQADRAWAEWIAWILEEDGHRVLVQAWDFVPGSNWTQDMQDGTAKSARTIAVLSQAYLESVYGAAEWQTAWREDPDGAKRKLILVRVTDCDRPGVLGSVVGIDLFDRTEAKAKASLRTAVETAISGRGKPAVAPGFPGGPRAIPRQARFPGALPTVWEVPARNPNFTGRDDEIAVIRRDLSTGSTVTVQSLRGLGGVGKTQLAVEYAHAHAGDYDVVWWIAAEEAATIPDHYAALARALGLQPADGPAELRTQVHDALRGAAGWLLIFDNADTIDAIQPWLPTFPLSAGTPGHVIVTTRRGGFGRLGRVLDLDVIDLPAAVRLLQGRVPTLDQEAAQKVAQTLDRLPLALEQAAAYLDRTGLTGDEYLTLLRTRADDVLTRRTAGQIGTTGTIATVWKLSLDRIQDENPAGRQLLDICAYLAPDAIPLDLFTNHPDLLPEPLSSAAGDPLAFTDTLAAIIDYSMAKRSPGGLQLHRLVQTAIRAQHGSDAHTRQPDPSGAT